MLKHILFLLAFSISVWGVETTLLDCNQVFEQRKDELVREMERIDERQQAFEAYQEASKSLMDKREVLLNQKMDDLNATLTKIEATKKEVVDIYEANKKVLEEIEKAKDEKISAAYQKMKDKKAAAILDGMPKEEAAKILFNLTPKKISTIMAKMSPEIAAEVTLLLKEGPPFNDKNSTE